MNFPFRPQRDLYSMKDMQEQLRSMLPNINISFGSFPHQQQAQQQQVPTSMHFSQQSQHLNKSKFSLVFLQQQKINFIKILCNLILR